MNCGLFLKTGISDWRIALQANAPISWNRSMPGTMATLAIVAESRKFTSLKGRRRGNQNESQTFSYYRTGNINHGLGHLHGQGAAAGQEAIIACPYEWHEQHASRKDERPGRSRNGLGPYEDHPPHTPDM